MTKPLWIKCATVKTKKVLAQIRSRKFVLMLWQPGFEIKYWLWWTCWGHGRWSFVLRCTMWPRFSHHNFLLVLLVAHLHPEDHHHLQHRIIATSHHRNIASSPTLWASSSLSLGPVPFALILHKTESVTWKSHLKEKGDPQHRQLSLLHSNGGNPKCPQADQPNNWGWCKGHL